MEGTTRLRGFPDWSQTPIPGVSLSAGGLLALADLSTVAQRTALTGGSSWLDSLLLVPGLHYQQAADELARRTAGGAITSVETEPDGRTVTRAINNAATLQFIQRVARPSEVVTVDVGMLPVRRTRSVGMRRRLSAQRQSLGPRASVCDEDSTPDLGWVSHLLYLISPVLTVAVIVLMVLFQDWWGLGCICALMLSRILNIWVIKQRAKHKDSPLEPPPPPSVSSSSASSALNQRGQPRGEPPNRLTSLIVGLPGGRRVRLRGTAADLQAVTVDAWMRGKTHIEGYLEATAKLPVYLVAAFSGNQTQAGSIVMMVLLLSSAGLLALSNAHAKGLTVNGRVVAPIFMSPPEENGNGSGGRRTHSDPLPSSQNFPLSEGQPVDRYADERGPMADPGAAWRRGVGNTTSTSEATGIDVIDSADQAGDCFPEDDGKHAHSFKHDQHQ